ncbi:MAG: Txe/YoeB family addiction module toxin [Cyanobacteria bacterium MAG CAR4_bin_6]|nr:Txe/YoeB family addiction module toxin [Cyanobacteria bacterium MAG CAR4_bin_6]
MWRLFFTKDAEKDMANLFSVAPSTRKKVLELLQTIQEDPRRPPYKALKGDLKGALSRRVNHKDRLVYEILPEENLVKVIRALTHYGD